MLRASLRFCWNYLCEVIAPLWLLFVYEATMERPGELVIPFVMKGRLYRHRVSYGMDYMDDYDGVTDKYTNIYIKRDADLMKKGD